MNILKIEEKTKVVNVLGYDFTIRCMFPKDLVLICQKRVQLQNGQSIESLTQGDFAFFENIATVDICTEKFPPGFSNNESCLQWDDIDLINGLADEIKSHTNDISGKLKKNRPITGISQE
jgi:hypothetical protein